MQMNTKNLERLVSIVTIALAISVITECKRAGGRVRRQSTFRVISEGQEFPCEGPQMTQYEEMGVPRVELNEEQKLALYRQLGGEFLSSFMGFRDQALNKPYSERGLSTSPWRIGHKVISQIDPNTKLGLRPMEPLEADADDSTKSTPTVYEYCNNRTDPAYDPQYLLMCTSCARSTKLGVDVWPNEFYETDCMLGQASCLFHQDKANGRCQQTKLWVSVLRKNTGVCVIALADGTTVITEEWYLDDMQINIGCECTVNKDSEFR